MLLEFIFPALRNSILAIIIILLYFLLKYSIIRHYYRKIIPTLNVRFMDILGHFQQFPYSYSRNEWNGYSMTTYVWQFTMGIFHLLKKEFLFIVWIGYFPFICLNSPEAVEEILNATSLTEKAWVYDWFHCLVGTGLFTSSGTKWKSRRKLLTPAFHFEILKDFLTIMNEKSRKLVKILEKETTMDFTDIVRPITLCSLDIICETALGVNIKAQENGFSNYVRAAERFAHEIIKRVTRPWCWLDFTYFLTSGRSVKKDIKILQDFTTSIIHEKKKSLKANSENAESHKPKRKSLMDILLEHHIETHELSEEDIREEVDTFTIAGQETITTTLNWALYLIGLYTNIQANLHKELDNVFGDDKERPVTNEDLKDLTYLECVIKETLRLYPPGAMIARKNPDKSLICGYPIPENSTLLICPYLLHRNEDNFPNPEKFDPNRFTLENSKNRHPYAYIPFSAGSRNCIGQRFAMMELKTVLSQILRNYTLESLYPRDKVLPSLEFTLRPTDGIRIKIRQRHLGDMEETQ